MVCLVTRDVSSDNCLLYLSHGYRGSSSVLVSCVSLLCCLWRLHCTFHRSVFV